jgi:hypothetical protein
VAKISRFYIGELLHLREILVTFELLKIKNMKKISVLFFNVLAAVLFSASIMAQEKAQTKLTSVKQSGETVRFSLTSSKPFIFANNRYVLYVGTKEFFGLEQSKKDGKGYMTFIIPLSDFNNLKDGDGMYLSYGKVDAEAVNMEELAKGRRCWGLGKFSKSLLK